METENRINDLELEMARHEAQCEERWKTTFNRLDDLDTGLKRIENRIMVAGGSIIVFLAGVIVTLLVG
jgi:hypothetical protein